LYTQVPEIRSLHLYAHGAKGGDSSEHIGTFQQSLYFRHPFSKRTKNNSAMGNGFVAGDRETTFELTAGMDEISGHDSGMHRRKLKLLTTIATALQQGSQGAPVTPCEYLLDIAEGFLQSLQMLSDDCAILPKDGCPEIGVRGRYSGKVAEPSASKITQRRGLIIQASHVGKGE
jgi:hypothetical protein